MEKAILVGVELPDSQYDIEYTLKELANLAKACDIQVVDKMSQKKPDISASFNYYDLHDISLHDRFHSSNCDTSRISLPPLHLNAEAEKFFTFSFELPDDFKKIIDSFIFFVYIRTRARAFIL